ncbi:anti-sigma factor antagonist [Mycobacterium sp.]|uniref:anti-sigma factor antagonist n=1 Tax=Mycobacterium sp. TaxID=1785 RepID=UPI003D0A5583
MKIVSSATAVDGGPVRLDAVPIGVEGESRTRRGRMVTIVDISGEIDVSNVEQVSDHAVCSALAGNALLLDMTGVGFFDAHGLSMLVGIEDICCASGLPWALVASPEVERVLYLSGLATVLPIAPSVRTAMEYLAHSTRSATRSRSSRG